MISTLQSIPPEMVANPKHGRHLQAKQCKVAHVVSFDIFCAAVSFPIFQQRKNQQREPYETTEHCKVPGSVRNISYHRHER